MATGDMQIVKDAVRAFVDEHFDEQVALLTRLVQCPSDNPPGDCAAHAELAAKSLEALGFVVERHPVDEATVRAAGMRSVTNLIVREVFGPGPTIALNAHGDVVPPGTGWSDDPYSGIVRDGWLYGRGAAVSKSDFTTYAYATLALRELRRLGVPFSGTVELHLTYDEETGGLVGPGWLLEQKLTAPDYVISAAFTHQVVVAHNGCLHLEITVKGRSAHAAFPTTGADAIEATSVLLNALYAYRDRLSERTSCVPGIGSPTFIVGLIEGGINTNVVADRTTLRIDRRIIPEEDPVAVEAELKAVVQQALAALPGVNVDVRRILLARPLKPSEASERLAALVCAQAGDILGEHVSTIGIPLYTDARLYSEAGIPTVMFGAGPADSLDANGHRANERVPLHELKLATRIVAGVLVELMGGTGHEVKHRD